MSERAAVGGSGTGFAEGHTVSNWPRLANLATRFDKLADPVVRDGLIDVYIRLQISEWSIRKASTMLARGKLPGPELSAAKLSLSSNLASMSNLVTGILGPHLGTDSGDEEASAWSEFALGVPGFRIAGGTDEILLRTLGERVLGLPREPSAPRR